MSKPRSSTVAPTTTSPPARGRRRSSAACARGARRAAAARRAAQAQDLALHRAHGRGAVGELARSSAGGHDDLAAATRRRRGVDTVAGSAPSPRAPRDSSPPARAQRGGQRVGHGARVHLGLVRREDGARHARRQARARAGALARRRATRRRARATRWKRVQAAQLLGVVAVGGDDERAAARGSRRRVPERSASSAANAGQRPADSRLSASSASSPNSASVTGASMPAATPEAPAPGSSRSSTQDAQPALRRRQAEASPITPAPTTTTSYSLVARRVHRSVASCGGRRAGSLRRHYPDQVQRSAATQPPSQPGSTELPCN